MDADTLSPEDELVAQKILAYIENNPDDFDQSYSSTVLLETNHFVGFNCIPVVQKLPETLLVLEVDEHKCIFDYVKQKTDGLVYKYDSKFSKWIPVIEITNNILYQMIQTNFNKVFERLDRLEKKRKTKQD